MLGWKERRLEILASLGELPERPSSPAASPDELVHHSILRSHDLQDARKDLPPTLKRIASNSLSIDDFRSLSTLSSSGPFNRVEIVTPGSTLTRRDVSTEKVFVVKTVDRRWAFRMRQQQSIVHELTILRLALSTSSTHSFPSRIPRLVASFLSPSSCHLVLSHAAGDDLWSLLETALEGRDPLQNEGLPEDWVKSWFAELVDAVEWLHEKGWAHRDIKPHNLLLLSSGHLQVTDFGSAAPLSVDSAPSQATSPPSSTFSTSITRKYAVALVGTPDYIAPEVLRHAEQVAEDSHDFESSSWRDGQDERAYGQEVDWWACGVVLYELLFGQAPFFAEGIAETYERIVDFQDYLGIPTTANVSPDAQDLIARLLVEPHERPTAFDIKRHPWFRQVEWSNLRSSTPPYTPPCYQPPAISPSTSFSHNRQSSASFTTFSNSFFSSPGLSILRPSPSTVEGAKKEERNYWEASEIGGLTTLPDPDAFLPDSSSSSSSSSSFSSCPDNPPLRDAASSRKDAPPVRSPPLALKDMSRFSFETPARRRRPPETSLTSGQRTNRNFERETPTSASARSRRHISDVEAWKEMQEHAWEVGMSAKKQGPRKVRTEHDKRATSTATEGREGGVEEGKSRDLEEEEKKEEKDLGALEARHEEMVKELEEMGKKYGSLFALASKETLNS